MNETKTLVEKITEGIQEKKGKNIIIADLTGIERHRRHNLQILYHLSGKFSQPSLSHYRLCKRLCTEIYGRESICHRRCTQCPMGSNGLWQHHGAYLLAGSARAL